MSGPWRNVARKLIAQPDYVLALMLLGGAAVALNFSTDYLKLHFRKLPVQLRVTKLDGPDGIPAKLGNWVQVSRDKPLDPDIEHILGTDKYVQRTYVNAAAIDPQVVQRLVDSSSDERDKALYALQAEHPETVINIGIFYYTGLVDTVAHIPERCYIADGFDVTNCEEEQGQNLGTYPDGRDRTLRFRYLNFEDQSGRNRVNTNVAYLFHVNGHYESDPLGVRRSLQNLLERYGYYAKVELMTISPGLSAQARDESRRKSLAAMADLLRSLLPEFERCLPDWDQLHSQPSR
ncbi:MAG TPA: exosortase-associated EpsI family protein [Tepidisphaeraceae bacterium]|nr:exosortase-associated EpsI family protein [Tepidisphaeraceae bacterium]